MMFPKTKAVRLTGKKQKELHAEVYKRDGGCCAICGAPLPEGVKAHHEPPKSHGGQDIKKNLVLLCQECHMQRHFSAPREYKAKCQSYLGRLYGERAQKRTALFVAMLPKF